MCIMATMKRRTVEYLESKKGGNEKSNNAEKTQT